MSSGFRPLRKEDVEEYVVFRQRLEEFLHLFTAWALYREKSRDDPEWPINLTLHVALQVWLYSFFDKLHTPENLGSCGGAGQTRTADLEFRKLSLYPN